MKQKIMIFCEAYPPSYKAGGGMQTVVNLIDRFADTYDFFVVTNNYDSKGDRVPFTQVRTDEWNDAGNATVFYASPSNISIRRFRELVAEIGPNAFFLNSTFSRPSSVFLFARRHSEFQSLPLILAVCGEFGPGALSLKPFRKQLFLLLAGLLGLYRDVIWKASFDEELDEIRSVIGPKANVLIAPDITPREVLPNYSSTLKPRKDPGSARFVFFSRLSRKKNIGYFLERLADVRNGEITVDFVGPIEDQSYWEECRRLGQALPPNISILVGGAFERQEDALLRVSRSHFFVLPTLNENFGYVFIEAMSAGCPVLTSDRTVWDDIEREELGWRIPLEDPGGWNRAIEECLEMDDETFRRMSGFARQFAVKWLANDEVVQANEKVLQNALGSSLEPVGHDKQQLKRT